MGLWTFAQCVPEDRQDLLSRWQTLEDVALAINLVAEVETSIWEKGTDPELLRCGRAAYKLRVPCHVYDAFFNSPAGYRAEYAISPNQGEKSNALLLGILMNKLLAAAPSCPIAQGVKVSLTGVQAKAWIDKEEVEDHLFDDTPEIIFPRWLHGCEGTAGVRAPVGTQLVIYGGWVDEGGREKINPKKTRRSQDIYECGFS
jgi:hypothetical protein